MCVVNEVLSSSKKQVERVLDTSLEQFEELLGQTARRDDVVRKKKRASYKRQKNKRHV